MDKRAVYSIARALYAGMLALYPPAFRARFEEPMLQIFDDLWRERKRQPGAGFLGFALGTFGDTGLGIAAEYLRLIRGGTMKKIMAGPRAAAAVGGLLCLPFIAVVALLMLNIEPNFGPLEPWLASPDPDQPDVGGSLVVLCLFLLLPLALAVVQRPIRQTLRAGGSVFAHPLNLALAAGILLVVAAVLIAIVVDQYPCWVGVPNCD